MIRKFFGFLFVLFLIVAALNALNDKDSGDRHGSNAIQQVRSSPSANGGSFRTGGLHTTVGGDGRVRTTPDK